MASVREIDPFGCDIALVSAPPMRNGHATSAKCVKADAAPAPVEPPPQKRSSRALGSAPGRLEYKAWKNWYNAGTRGGVCSAWRPAWSSDEATKVRVRTGAFRRPGLNLKCSQGKRFGCQQVRSCGRQNCSGEIDERQISPRWVAAVAWKIKWPRVSSRLEESFAPTSSFANRTSTRRTLF